MKFLFYFILFFSTKISIHGQTVRGRIVNDEDATALSAVVIENLNRPDYNTISDNEGHYSIAIKSGDSIKFTLLGFSPQVIIFNEENEGWFSWIGMQPQSYVIDTVVVRKGLTAYKRDSLEKRGIYGKKVDYRPAKPQLPKLKELEAGKPFVIKAPISGFIEKRQKKYKRLKVFQQRYTATETQNFIDSRYTSALVTELTTLNEDSLMIFMQAYPMSYSFARAASDMEIKMWIRYNYREWITKPIVIPPDISMPNLEADTFKKP